MTKQEFAQAMALLSAAIDRPIGKTTIAAWYEFVQDLPGTAVLAAVQTIIATDEYPTLPSIGKIRKTAIELSKPKTITAAEAWGLTIKAIRSYGHNREKEALEKLPPEAARIAEMMGWQQMCHADNVEVIRGQFMKMFDQVSARDTQERLIPPQARALLAGLGRSLSLPEGGKPDERKNSGRDPLDHGRPD
jgi:hypothetical protein